MSETDCGTMYLLDRNSGSFALTHSIGFSSDFLEAISQRKRNPNTSLIARANKPIYIRYQDGDLPLQEAREREGLRAMAVVVPVHHEGEVIGYYSVGTHTLDEFPPSRRSALETIAAMTGNAIARLRAEEELRKSEEKYRTLLEDQTDLICRFLPDWTLTFANEAYCRYFGRVREDMVGQSFISLIPEEDRQKARDHVASLSKDRPVATCVHRVILPNGEVRWQQWTDRAILDERGAFAEFQSSGQDITERKLTEGALKESEARLKMVVEGANLGIWDLEPGHWRGDIQREMGRDSGVLVP